MIIVMKQKKKKLSKKLELKKVIIMKFDEKVKYINQKSIFLPLFFLKNFLENELY